MESLYGVSWALNPKHHRYLEVYAKDSDRIGNNSVGPDQSEIGRVCAVMSDQIRRVFGDNSRIIEPPRDKTNKMTAPSEASDQPGHPPSHIRVFAVRSVGS